MITFAIFCIQVSLIQYVYTQTVTTPIINNALSPGLPIPGLAAPIPGQSLGLAGSNIGYSSGLAGQIVGPNIGFNNAGLAGQIIGSNIGYPGLAGQIAGSNIGYSGLAGQMLGPLQGAALSPMNPTFALSSGQSMGISPGYSGYPLAAYGGNGSGDVAVAGELPVAGTTAISGQVPMSGKVQFTGTVPAGGIVTITGQCGCGCNGANAGAPYAKPGYNKPYLY